MSNEVQNKRPGGDLAFRVNSNELKFRHWKQPKGKRKAPVHNIQKSKDVKLAEEEASSIRRLPNPKPLRAKKDGGDVRRILDDPIGDDKEEYKRQQHSQLMILFYDPSSSNIDPFHALGQEASPGSDVALHHWTTDFRTTRVPLTPRSEWIQASISNPTLLKAAITSSTAHILNMQGQINIPRSFYQQKNDAIVAINKDLAVPDLIPSDALIMAVSAMVIIECFNGTPGSCAIHKKGVNLLVMKRGGVENLGFNGLVKRTVSWADTLTAMTLRQKPLFNPLLTLNAGESHWPSPLHTTSFTSLHIRLHSITSSPLLSSALTHIYARLHQLTTFLLIPPQPLQSELDSYLMSDKFDALERQIISVLSSNSLAIAEGSVVLIAFLNAAYAFVIRCFREIPRGNQVCNHVVNRIVSGLEMVDLNELLEVVPDLVVWTILVGRIGSPQRGGAKVFFKRSLDDVLGSLGMSCAESLRPEECFAVAEQALRVVEGRRMGLGIAAQNEASGVVDLNSDFDFDFPGLYPGA